MREGVVMEPYLQDGERKAGMRVGAWGRGMVDQNN